MDAMDEQPPEQAPQEEALLLLLTPSEERQWLLATVLGLERERHTRWQIQTSPSLWGTRLARTRTYEVAWRIDEYDDTTVCIDWRMWLLRCHPRWKRHAYLEVGGVRYEDWHAWLEAHPIRRQFPGPHTGVEISPQRFRAIVTLWLQQEAAETGAGAAEEEAPPP